MKMCVSTNTNPQGSGRWLLEPMHILFTKPETDPLLSSDGLGFESGKNEGDCPYREEPQHLQELRHRGEVQGLRQELQVRGSHHQDPASSLKRGEPLLLHGAFLHRTNMITVALLISSELLKRRKNYGTIIE